MNNILEEQIKGTIEKTAGELVKNGIRGNGPWTNAMMTALTALAYDEYNYWVYSKPNAYDDTINEWLYDMTWYESHDDKGKNIKAIHLILESEWNWNFEEIEYDFTKLLQGRAGLRVFIFQTRNIQQSLKLLTDTVEKSTIAEKGDRYLFAGWNDQVGFEFYFHIKQ